MANNNAIDTHSLISVIVPIYNVEQYLRKCVDSIFAQTYSNLEIILVDDGSPDGCPKICDDYATKDSRVKVIHKHNGGLSDARNTGLDIASGEYISFIDSDDYVAENFIEKLYGAIKANDADVAFCNFTCVDEEGKPLPGNAGFKNFSVQENTLLDELKFWNTYYMGYMACTVAWSKLYRRKIFSDLRFPVGKINEDEFILHHVTQKSNYLVPVNDALYFYLQRTNSIMNTVRKKINFDVFEALEERYEYLISKGWNSIADKCMRQIYFTLNIRHLIFKEQICTYRRRLEELDRSSNHRHTTVFLMDRFLFGLGFGIYNFTHGLKMGKLIRKNKGEGNV